MTVKSNQNESSSTILFPTNVYSDQGVRSKTDVQATVFSVRAPLVHTGYQRAFSKRTLLNVSGPARADPPDIQVSLNSVPFTGHLIQKGIVNLPSLAKAHVQTMGGPISKPRALQDVGNQR